MRQAIVVIHGIGEQRPMDTVRGFVKAVMPQPENPNKPKFWSKPDPLSESFELRKLTTPQSKEMPPTDFYEYYWAYQAEGTKVVHVLSWAWSLLARRPGNVPRHLRVLWSALWILILTTAVLMATSPWAKSVSIVDHAIKANYLLSALTSLALLLISGIIVNYVGDAARYLNPSPANIEMRRRIRKEGVDLVRRLHESKEYDRIVLVGHSLGSVIAYDIVRNLWPQYNQRESYPPETDLGDLIAVEKTGEALTDRSSTGSLEAFRKLQTTLWQKELSLSNQWRVTDLITIGSPLAHAALLLARNGSELIERVKERELPTCPPAAEEGKYAYDPAAKDEERKRYVLHHAAMFACTRWTNLYFPAKLGFFGDLVGGPLRSIFGAGIRDVAVDSAEWGGWLKHTPLIHTHYWKARSVPQNGREQPKAWALEALQQALDLNSRAWLRSSLSARTAKAGSSQE